MKSATAEAFISPVDLPSGSRFSPGAMLALFTLTLRQDIRGRRMLILSLLFLLPSVLVAVVRSSLHPPPPPELEFAFVFNLIPHALVPLVALLYASGMIQDEVEEQTLTYLLVRPLPRRALYFTRLLATWLVTSVLTGVGITIAFAVIWWGKPQLWVEVLPERAAKTAGILALAQLAYCAFFGTVGMFTRRSLFVGLAYIVAFEGLLANVPMVVRQLTVMYYFRVLALRWLSPAKSDAWNIELDKAGTTNACVWTLLIASAVLAAIGAQMMAWHEFRMKTPEGS
jgi:ABC-2 type transport system permease protein